MRGRDTLESRHHVLKSSFSASASSDADSGRLEIGDNFLAADQVRSWRYSVEASDIDLFRKFNGVINLDAKIANSTLDLGMAKQELHCSEVASSPVDQHRLCPAQ